MDRLIFAGLYRLAPTVLHALAVLKPDTVIKRHRIGFRSYWRARGHDVVVADEPYRQYGVNRN
jgi:hypothetical protein